MKNIYSLIIALLMIATLNISRVSADTETPTPSETPTVTVTPSPTAESLFPTAEATENYSDCPVATLDPNQYVDPMYFMQCYQCMPTATKTMTSTITLTLPTVTGTPKTNTPTATDDGNTTGTPTTTPTQDFTPYTVQDVAYAEELVAIYDAYGTYSGDVNNLYGPGDNQFYFYSPQANLGTGIFGLRMDKLVPAGSNLYFNATGCRDQSDRMRYSEDGDNWTGFTNPLPVDARYIMIILNPCSSQTVGLDYVKAVISEIEVTNTPYPTPEIIATNTPVSGYCNNWDYLETGAQNQIASVSNIQIYAPEEIILLRGDYIDLSWIGSERLSEPIGWPTIALSVIKVDLGDIYLLGFRLPVEIIVLPFVMFAISLLMRL